MLGDAFGGGGLGSRGGFGARSRAGIGQAVPGMPGIRIGPRIGEGFTQQFLPFQRRLYEQGGQHALGQLQQFNPAGQDSFESLLKTVGGEPTPFTDIPQSAYLSPEILTQMQNTIFAEGAARTGAQQEQIREGAIPGATSRFGIGEQLAGAQRANDAIAQRSATQLAGEYAPTINRLAATAQTGVEAERAADDRQRRSLTLARMRDQLQRENALLAALGQFGAPLGYDPGREHVAAYPFAGFA